MSARNPLIVRADICGFSARSSAEKVKFSVSCTVPCDRFLLFPVAPNDETKSVEHVMYRDQQKIVFNKTQKKFALTFPCERLFYNISVAASYQVIRCATCNNGA